MLRDLAKQQKINLAKDFKKEGDKESFPEKRAKRRRKKMPANLLSIRVRQAKNYVKLRNKRDFLIGKRYFVIP